MTHLERIVELHKRLAEYAQNNVARADMLREINKEYIADTDYESFGVALAREQIELEQAEIALESQTAKERMMKCGPAAFTVGQHVNHAANADGMFPAGCGKVESITPWNDCLGYSYQVRCDKTGQVLPVNFKESELSPIP